MTHRIAFRATLWVRSPFLFRGLESRQLGLDAPQLRDEQQRPIIPGDQLRGVLREAFVDLAAIGVTSQTEIDDLFGRASHGEREIGTSNDPLRGRIVISDMTARGMVYDLAADSEEPLPDVARATETTRIEIDDALGAAKHGMLQVVELAAPLGAAVRFCGEIVIFGPAADTERLESLLNRALRLIPAIGAFKSAGFGEVLADRVKIERSGTPYPLAPPRRAQPLPSSGFMSLRATFDRPLLVDAEWLSQNAFRGSPIVPGTVFKGALARRLELAGHDPTTGMLGRALAELSFSHAFPESDEPGRPGALPLPLSVVAVKDDAGVLHFGDALRVPDGRGATLAGRPALFAGDWKEGWADDEELRRALGRPKYEDPLSLARTHTEIKDGVAKDEALFTGIARSVRRRDGRDRAWLLDVDLGGIAEGEIRDCAVRLVTILLEDGLDNIGKTGARATFELTQGVTPPRPAPIHDESNRYAIVLATPALMLDPARLCGSDGTWRQEPRKAYEAYWSALLPDSRLHGFFARQRLAGGYLARRRRLYGPERYFPFLVTEAGSVFEIETGDRPRLEKLWRYGLPPAAMHDDGKRLKLDWKNCPYLPENGYGRLFGHLTTSGQKALLTKVCDV
jgi:CRISPR/Cas system CSM-associated protein Csm3 (group 7 of RAMP superfamily)